MGRLGEQTPGEAKRKRFPQSSLWQRVRDAKGSMNNVLMEHEVGERDESQQLSHHVGGT